MNRPSFTNRRLDRRSFLKGLAIAGMATSLSLTSLVRAARAATAAKRTIFIYIPDGCIPDLWHPTGSEFSFTLPAMTQPLSVVQQHCTFLSGLQMFEGGATHEGGVRKVLTGNAAQSLDDFLAEQIGGATAFPSLYLGVGANYENGSGGFSFLSSGSPVSPEDNPINAYERIFGDGTTPPPGAGDPRLPILDTASAELQALQTQLGSTERQKLERHLDSLREVEQRLEAAAGVSCDPSGWNPEGFTVPSGWHGYPPVYDREENFVLVGKLQTDLIVEALACDLTRVASLQWSHPVSPTHLSWAGAGQRHHDASHYGNPSSTSAQDFIASQQWFTARFAELLQSLEARPDPSGDGNLLDHTRVLLFSELGDSNLHDHRRCPFVLAGASAEFQNGRLLEFEDEAHTKLLVSIARSMDVPISTYGYSGHGTGGLPGLGI
ncbi:MAG: DUF1552 domain-containing protein [Candidatus Binatia bacterium]|nr:DUF1552 domain-containing protein [Candidatus Binatia bacterium]